jgi:thiamine-monophosphate kinase
MPPAPQTVAALGEFALIDRLAAILAEAGAAAAPDLLGIGDDAAIWTPTPGTRAVITTDSLIAGVHFRLDWTGWRDLGHKALAANLSDVAAMGARPRLATVSLALTGAEPVAGLLELYRGLGALAARHGVVVAGGDIVASPERLGLHVTVVGESWPDADGALLTRDRARPGELLAVSGPLGRSAAGLELLQSWVVSRESRAGDGSLLGDLAPAIPHLPHDSRLTTHDFLAAHHRPTPQLAYGRAIVAAGGRVAMDLSDGLFGDLAKICARSGVGALVEEEALPVPDAVRAAFPDEWLRLATRGGEDYELLFSADRATIDRLRALCAARALPAPATIGTITAAPADGPPIRLRRADGREEAVGGGAFDHFGGG